MGTVRETRFSYARILVVDDSIFDRRLITLALKKAGFTKIFAAVDGADAIQKTYDLIPDLVLLDLKMPNLDGFGYCEMVRNDKTLPRMPIIVQTAMQNRQAWLHALSCGADDFLTKPLDMAELTLRISVQVERYFMMRELENMCEYLKMELDLSRSLRMEVDHAGLTPANVNTFNRHFEVIEQIVHASSYGKR